MLNRKYPERLWQHYLTLPFIYIMIFPLVILDIFMAIYHTVCFRLYRLPLLKRSNYIKIDRHKLKYLPWWDKMNCAYCGYANGLAHYFTVMAAETEKYWCGIKHQKDPNFIAPVHHQDFLEYGDEKALEKLPLK